MKNPIGIGLAACGLLLACAVLWGCPNPNYIGVQTFGVVQVTCVQASNNQPVAGALVQVDGQTPQSQTNSAGTILVPGVPIGSNIPVNCNAPGLTGTATIPSLTATNTSSDPLPITVQMTPG
ncbi:MAG TPA: hypothetical protein VEJ41_10475 [Candidatus Acidoferrales bacterium]|nr:hypothetical protein [Candidatus Acidoferrales bacterium]